jgi:aryl-alcohol dehydrogenase-like predicted oxidoreductase
MMARLEPKHDEETGTSLFLKVVSAGGYMEVIDQRKLGKSELVIPALGVGIWSWGDTMWWDYGRTYTQDDITQAYQACLDAGLTFFDTAEIYGNGASERLLGECRKADERPITIASKFAPPLTPFSIKRNSASSLLQALDDSLQRLGVECIDLYQIHYPSQLLKIDALMDAMAEAVQAGKIRAVGVSNYSAVQMRQAQTRLAKYGIPLASNQVRYSLLYRYPETNGVLDACRELGIALIAYSPLEQGVLTGKYRSQDTSASLPWMLKFFLRLDPYGDTKGQVTPIQRWLATPRILRREQLEPLFVVMEEIAQAHNKTIAQVALNWLLTKDDLIIPIPGAKNARQARENVGAIGWRLTDDEHSRISGVEIATR